MAPIASQYRSVTPRSYLSNIQPASMEQFAHGYSTPSEDLNIAFQPYRNTSGGNGSQRGTSGYTVMYMPHENQRNGTGSRPGLRRHRPEHDPVLRRGAVSGTMPVQSIPHDEVSISISK
jgi:hypothetical protein